MSARISFKSIHAFSRIFSRSLSDIVRKSITNKIKEAPVVLFMKGTPAVPQCGFSRATVQILGLQGVDPSKLKTHNVLEDKELREGIKEFSEWPTIPQLFINQEFIGGCDILISMHQSYQIRILNAANYSSGELETLLEKAGVLVPECKNGGTSGRPK